MQDTEVMATGFSSWLQRGACKKLKKSEPALTLILHADPVGKACEGRLPIQAPFIAQRP